jgi:hypothetical protein
MGFPIESMGFWRMGEGGGGAGEVTAPLSTITPWSARRRKKKTVGRAALVTHITFEILHVNYRVFNYFALVTAASAKICTPIMR